MAQAKIEITTITIVGSKLDNTYKFNSKWEKVLFDGFKKYIPNLKILKMIMI